MKVMMLNSLDGLRGLGDADLERKRIDARVRFADRLAPMEHNIGRLLDASNQAMIPTADYDAFNDRLDVIERQIAQRMDALDAAATVEAVSAWEQGNDAVLRSVDAWVADVRRVIGDERSRRGLKIGLLTLGAAVLLGGGAYVLTRRFG